jgi:SAM-dependent methyltransferase
MSASKAKRSRRLGVEPATLVVLCRGRLAAADPPARRPCRGDRRPAAERGVCQRRLAARESWEHPTEPRQRKQMSPWKPAFAEVQAGTNDGLHSRSPRSTRVGDAAVAGVSSSGVSDCAPGMDSARWRKVGANDDGDFFVGYLDRAAIGLRDARLELMQALDVTERDSVLDVGSGVGEFLLELVGRVPGVRAVGVDASPVLIETARRRSDAAGRRVEFRVGDVEDLGFPDGSFSRVNCSRVLLHLNRPERAVEEMARVLSPGGRVAIWEADFDALMVDSDDLATATAVRRHLVAGLRNPDIGRRLGRLVLSAGLELVEVSSIARSASSLEYADNQFHLLAYLDAAVAAGDVSVGAATAWREWLEAADARGQLFVAPVGFHVIARKPPDRGVPSVDL